MLGRGFIGEKIEVDKPEKLKIRGFEADYGGWDCYTSCDQKKRKIQGRRSSATDYIDPHRSRNPRNRLFIVP